MAAGTLNNCYRGGVGLKGYPLKFLKEDPLDILKKFAKFGGK
jgi:hypothetical protein